MLNMKTELFSQPKPQSESGPADQDCPEHPVAKADALGRLGNQISTYVNHIALQWEYGYRLYLSDTIATNMQKIMDNVTFPSTTETMIDRCHISFWSKAADWVLFTKFLDREKLTCEETRNETVEPQKFLDMCMDKELDRDSFHINVKIGHNKPDWDLLGSHISSIRKYHLQINIDLQTTINLILEQQRQ